MSNEILDSLSRSTAHNSPAETPAPSQEAVNTETQAADVSVSEETQNKETLDSQTGNQEAVVENGNPEEQGTQESEPVNNSDSAESDKPTSEVDSSDADNQDGPAWFEDEKSENTEESSFDFSDIGKSIGLEIKSKDELVNAFTELKQESDQNKEKLDSELSNIFADDAFKEANEIKKTGGNWQEYLQISDVDWDTQDDVTLLTEFKLARHMTQEQSSEYLAKLTDAEIKMEGSAIRDQLKFEQSRKLSEIAETARKKKEKHDTGIRQALESTSEMYGFKMTPAVKSKIQKDLISGDFLNNLFRDKDGNPNYSKMIEVSLLSNNIKDVVKANAVAYANKGKKDVIEEVSNIEVKSNGSLPNPKSASKPTGMDAYMAQLRENGPN